MTTTRPRTAPPRRLAPRARKVWLTAHVASFVGWLADTGSTGWEIVTVSVCTVLVLTAVTAISVFKPWGRTRWNRRSSGSAQ